MGNWLRCKVHHRKSQIMKVITVTILQDQNKLKITRPENLFLNLKFLCCKWGENFSKLSAYMCVIQGPAVGAKILRKPEGVCTSFLADTPPKQASSTVFDPRRSATRTLRSRIFGPKFISAMHCRKNRAESVQPMQIRR